MTIKSIMVAVFAILSFSALNCFSAEGPSEFDAIAKDIQAGVKSLEYPDQVGQELINVVKTWKCVEWKQKLAQARQDLQGKKIAADQASGVEKQVAVELFEAIQHQLLVEDEEKMLKLGCNDLGIVLKHKKGNSCSFAQAFLLIGQSVGLSVKVVYGSEPDSENATLTQFPQQHTNAGVELANGKIVVFDIACKLISEPFLLSDEFRETGAYLEAKVQSPLGIHSKIQLWDKNGLLSLVYYWRGAACFSTKKNSDAISFFSKAIQLNPVCALPYAKRGAAYRKDSNFGLAIADLQKAVELDPKSMDFHRCLGELYFKMGKNEESLAELTKAVELYPESSKALSCRANILGLMHRNSEAFEDAKKAAEKDPKNVDAFCIMAAINYSTGKYEDACVDVGKAIELEPRQAGHYRFLANIHFTMGKYEEAIADYDKIIEINPRDARAYFTQGNLYSRLKKLDEAKKNFQQALKMDKSLENEIRAASAKYGLDMPIDL